MQTGGRILIVEDQRGWQEELNRILIDSSYSIKIADNLMKARDLLKNHVFDLVLLDLRLRDWDEGNFDGWELMDALVEARNEQGTQVIIFTAYAMANHVRQGFKNYRIWDFLDKKRFNLDEFSETVSGAIARAYIEREEIVDAKYS